MPYVDIGGRSTFQPPFVNERFTRPDPEVPDALEGPPYWACSYATGVNAANVAKFGTIPATHAEVIALAKASGDTTLTGGSKTSELQTALLARYRLTAHRQNVSDAEARRRLANGWVLVAGCYYGKLPDHFRRWSPNFTGGHRVALFGWASGKTRLLDPMASYGTTYGGELIAWTDFTPSFWSDEQLWILEGELMQTVVTVHAVLDPPRRFRVKAGTTLHGYSTTQLRKTVAFSADSAADFDRYITIDQAPDSKFTPHGEFIRPTAGGLAGLYVPLAEVVVAPEDLVQTQPSETVIEAARIEAARVATTTEQTRVRALRDQAVQTLGGI